MEPQHNLQLLVNVIYVKPYETTRFFSNPVSDPDSNTEPKRLFRFRIGSGSGKKFRILPDPEKATLPEGTDKLFSINFAPSIKHELSDSDIFAPRTKKGRVKIFTELHVSSKRPYLTPTCRISAGISTLVAGHSSLSSARWLLLQSSYERQITV